MKRKLFIFSVICVVLAFSVIFSSCANTEGTESTTVITEDGDGTEKTDSGTLDDGIFIVSYTGTNGTVIGLTEYGKSLPELTVPPQINGKNILAIGSMAFTDKDAYFFEDTTSISEVITKVTLPEGLETIEMEAFLYCSNLTNINIPSTVTYIGWQVFVGCFALEYEIYGNLKYLGNWCMDVVDYKTITTAELKPDTVGIHDNVFSGCYELTSIKIPDSVVYMGSEMFNESEKIEYETYGNLKYLGNWCAGTDDKSITSIEFKPGTIGIVSNSFRNCTKLSSVIIPEGVICISGSAFSYCNGLSNITLPDTLKYIGTQAFIYCHKLSDISLPSDISYICNGAFFECTGLTDIIIPAGITFLDCRAFDYCTEIINIKMSVGVSKKYHSNNNCIIETGSKLLIIGVKNCIIPDDGSVTALSNHAFLGAGITDLTIPNNIKSIGNSAFSGCELTSITYKGTKAEWDAINNILAWNWLADEITVHCTDGDVIVNS